MARWGDNEVDLKRNEFWVMSHDPTSASIKLVWTDDTRRMTDDDFKHALELFIGFAERHRTPNLYVDVRLFRKEMSPELGDWRAASIVPRYNASGIKKFAYVVPAPASPTSKSAAQRFDGEDFFTEYFISEGSAVDWLKSAAH